MLCLPNDSSCVFLIVLQDTPLSYSAAYLLVSSPIICLLEHSLVFSSCLSSAGKIRLPVNFELKFSSPLFTLLIQRNNYRDRNFMRKHSNDHYGNTVDKVYSLKNKLCRYK